jgi:hypothetical protein
MVNGETTTTEIMEFLQEHAATKEDLAAIVQKMATKEDLQRLKFEMMDSFDEKLVNLKGDLVVLMRGEDQKLVALIQVLKEKQVLNDVDVKTLLALQPFPQMSSS